jgi:hypothetical protein
MWVIGAVIAAVGLTMATIGLLTPVSFGWFAYQPLADASFGWIENAVIVTRGAAAGLLLLGIGLVILAFQFGTRSRSTTDVTGR